MGGSCGSIEDGDFFAVFVIGGVKILIIVEEVSHLRYNKNKRWYNEKRLYHGSQFIIQKPEYGKGKKEKADINELFILDIMREGIKNGDARLFWGLFANSTKNSMRYVRLCSKRIWIWPRLVL